MIIIGERINSSRKRIKEAIDDRALPFLLNEAKNQLAAGASFIDINCAACMDKEEESMVWLISQLQSRLGCSISIDSPNPSAIKAALRSREGAVFINSITAEDKKLDELLPIISGQACSVVALTLGDSGMPQDIDTRMALAEKIAESAKKKGFSRENIYIDPLVRPISTEPRQAGYFLEAVRLLKRGGFKTVGGLSNVSFGLPCRELLNAAFLKLSMEYGIDAVIIDPTAALTASVLNRKAVDKELFKLARASLMGEDLYSMNYIRAFREGRLTV